MKGYLSKDLTNEQLSISRKHLLSEYCIPNPTRHFGDAKGTEEIFK